LDEEERRAKELMQQATAEAKRDAARVKREQKQSTKKATDYLNRFHAFVESDLPVKAKAVRRKPTFHLTDFEERDGQKSYRFANIFSRLRVYHGSSLLENIDQMGMLAKILISTQVSAPASRTKFNLLAGTGGTYVATAVSNGTLGSVLSLQNGEFLPGAGNQYSYVGYSAGVSFQSLLPSATTQDCFG
jgi:hypothetical protein